MSRCSALVLLGLLTLGMCWTIPLSAQADDADWQSLSRGNVVIRQNAPAGVVPSVEARILVPRPPDKVWSVVSDPETLMRDDTRVKKVRMLSRSGNRQQVEFSVLMTRLLPPFNYVLQQDLMPNNTVRFRRVSGSFKDIQGSWRLWPVENGSKTILSYTLQLDPGPLVPRGMLLGAVKSDLPNMMQNAKSAILKNGR